MYLCYCFRESSKAPVLGFENLLLMQLVAFRVQWQRESITEARGCMHTHVQGKWRRKRHTLYIVTVMATNHIQCRWTVMLWNDTVDSMLPRLARWADRVSYAKGYLWRRGKAEVGMRSSTPAWRYLKNHFKLIWYIRFNQKIGKIN